MMSSCDSPKDLSLALSDADSASSTASSTTSSSSSSSSSSSRAKQKSLTASQLLAISIQEDAPEEETTTSESSLAKDLPSSTASTSSKLTVGGPGPDATCAQLEVELTKQQQSSPLDEKHLASDGKTFVNAIISFLGSGVLGLPFAFRQCGIFLGLVILVSVASISTFCMLLIIKCKYKLKQQGVDVTTYGQIGGHLLGQPGVFIVNVALIVSQSGFGIAYLIFIATNAHQFFGFPKELIVACCLPPLIGFSFLKHMKQLAYVALLADVMNFAGLAVVYYSDLLYMPSDHDKLQIGGVVSSMPFFFGVACYCFEGVGMVLPLENSMANKHHFTPILIATVVIITSVYATFGICGYLAFGNSTKDVITLNFEAEHGQVAMIVKLLLCAGLFFTYPLMLFPVFEVLEPLILSAEPKEPRLRRKRLTIQVQEDLEDSDKDHLDSGDEDEPEIDQENRHNTPMTQEEVKFARQQEDLQRAQLTKWRSQSRLLRAGVVLLTGCLAAGIPNFGAFISFIGSTCCSMLAFVLPSLFALMLFRESNALGMKIFLSVLMGIGVIAMMSGVFDGLSQLLGS